VAMRRGRGDVYAASGERMGEDCYDGDEAAWTRNSAGGGEGFGIEVLLALSH
jgi:hypothetical protein